MPAKEQKVKELTVLSTQPNFWNNQEEARNTLEELARLKNELEALETLELELIEAKGDGNETKETNIAERLEEFELRTLLNGPHDKGDAVMSFYAGAGGRDAEDWTGMLLSMYQKYCENEGWKVELLHEQYGPEGGLKEATLEIKGYYAYGLLKKEGGVHRLVRISPFSGKQLRHTSFALVEVLPQHHENDHIELQEKNLRIDTFRSSGPGGQNVNRRESAVRVTHLPTGLSAASQSERSQAQNRQRALALLKSKLILLLEQQKKESIDALQEKVKPEWGNQARSYILDPYTLVKDHRTGKETQNVEAVLAGGLSAFIEAQTLQNNIQS